VIILYEVNKTNQQNACCQFLREWCRGIYFSNSTYHLTCPPVVQFFNFRLCLFNKKTADNI